MSCYLSYVYKKEIGLSMTFGSAAWFGGGLTLVVADSIALCIPLAGSEPSGKIPRWGEKEYARFYRKKPCSRIIYIYI